MRYYIRIEILSLQYKSFWGIHHVSPILCKISEHLQDALLIKLLESFLKYIKVNLFLVKENLF